MNFSPADLQQLAKHGVAEAEAQRQAALLAQPPRALPLLKPATVGDGILRLDETAQTQAEAKGSALLASVRILKFVPASGAATRMFKELLTAVEGPGGLPQGDTAKVLEQAPKFAFFDAWEKAVAAKNERAFDMLLAKGQWHEVLKALLFAPGLDYAQQPKAFLDFHQVDGQARTALEEQWRETLALGLDQLHFTISPEHAAAFDSLEKALHASLLEEELPSLRVTYSFQDPATDTLAGDGQGGLFRDAEGLLVLRPGGHGALIKNLKSVAASADVAIIKNIDNISHPRLWPAQLKWKRILAGVLASELDKGWDRPVRVVGVVPNTGEPGGGPFWVRDAQGESLQIVESAQVDLKDPAQAAIFKTATHFNPVDLVCRLTDAQGKPFDLDAFVDPEAVFLSQKSYQGKPLVALERPGLWNGAMARWKTIFVEVPLETFNPVKVVSDLLKPAHQP
jgi:hypothetical protein